MFVGTFNSFGGIQEIKTGNKTKEQIAECGPLGVTTPSVPQVETDVADSGAQSGSVSESWPVMLSMVR